MIICPFKVISYSANCQNVYVNVILSAVLNTPQPSVLTISWIFICLLGICCLVYSRATPVWNITEQLANQNENFCKGNSYLGCHWGKSPKGGKKYFGNDLYFSSFKCMSTEFGTGGM